MAPKKQILVVIAVVLATIGIGSDVSVASAQTAPYSNVNVVSPQQQAAAAVASAINSTRVAHGLPVLWWGVRVTGSAHGHNLWMAAYNTLSHQLPGEAPLGTRISAWGVAWTWVGENVGENYSMSTAGALQLEQMMMTEVYPGHRDNILSRNVFLVGVDVVFDTVHHRLWLTEDFAN
ncbi:MAG TPA: CAP domain-containing protein [Candidatus Dormibacteraeota bacterium]|nr:CAP domain-containing protein [Candidatus Dormibacteraeota bacterium]